MSAPAHEAGMMSGRSTVMLVTVALHLLLISALMISRVRPPPGPDVRPMQSWFETEPLIEVPDTVTAVSPDRNWKPARVPVSQPTLQLPTEPVVVLQPDPGVFEPGPPVLQAPERVSAPTPLGFRSTRPSDDYYPAQSIRSGEQGVVIVNACVTALGELSRAPEVAVSSGAARLDAAAVAWVREAVRFQPATRNGEAVAACKGFRVNFRLR